MSVRETAYIGQSCPIFHRLCGGAIIMATNIDRPVSWTEHSWARVAFIAHALMAQDPSTAIITRRLRELGRGWPNPGEDPGYIRWFSFPVIPTIGRKVWVDFYIIPVLAPEFLVAVKSGQAYNWSERVALHALEEAWQDNVDITIGWGALTKVATNHGQLFLDRHPELAHRFASTHGDAGTAVLNVHGVPSAGFKPGFRVSVIGAYGATGDAISRALVHHRPAAIQLVGRPDHPGESKNLLRLLDLKRRVESLVHADQQTKVVIHQDKSVAALEHRSDMVVVATNGMNLMPGETPEGSVSFDLCSPPACRLEHGWNGNRLVLTQGCAELPRAIIPRGFGEIAGSRIWDVGAGGSRVIWGCTAETITRAVFNWQGHLAGPDIPPEALEWAEEHFDRLGVTQQPPTSFGRLSSWPVVRGFVRDAADRKGRQGGAL